LAATATRGHCGSRQAQTASRQAGRQTRVQAGGSERQMGIKELAVIVVEDGDSRGGGGGGDWDTSRRRDSEKKRKRGKH